MRMESKQEDDHNNGFNFVFFKRFSKLHSLLFPGIYSLSIGLFGLLLSFALLEEVIVSFVGLIPSGFYQVLGDKDLDGFIRQTLQSILLILAVAIVKSVKNYVSLVLNLTWRQLLTRATHRLYYSGINYYRLNVFDKIVDNPDQRITRDINTLCEVYSMVAVKAAISPFTISYYTYKAYTGTGWVGPTSCFVFFIIGTVFNKLVMSPVVKWVVKQEQREGDFRYKHMQIRSNAESLAFLKGARLEEMKSNQKLDILLKTKHHLYRKQLGLNLAVNTFDYLGSIISYLALAVPIFTGRYDDVPSSELSSLISQNSFVCIYLISTFSSLVDLSSSVTNLAGVTHRVAELIERLHQLDDQFYNQPNQVEIIRTANQNSNLSTAGVEQEECCSLKGASFKAPGSTQELVKDLNVHLRPGQSIFVTGSSSAGKTSLLRVFRGLWRLNGGTIATNYAPGPRGVLFLPQRPYLTDGTLREQITFPLSVDMQWSNEEETEQLLNYIRMTRMEGLLERVGGLDRPVEWNWYDVLSPGEMQRLSFIRLLHHRPSIAFLDEATSALDMEMEYLLYTAAVQNGITLISVGHRQNLRQFHRWVLHLNGDGSWSMQPISINDS